MEKFTRWSWMQFCVQCLENGLKSITEAKVKKKLNIQNVKIRNIPGFRWKLWKRFSFVSVFWSEKSNQLIVLINKNKKKNKHFIVFTYHQFYHATQQTFSLTAQFLRGPIVLADTHTTMQIFRKPGNPAPSSPSWSYLIRAETESIRPTEHRATVTGLFSLTSWRGSKCQGVCFTTRCQLDITDVEPKSWVIIIQ